MRLATPTTHEHILDSRDMHYNPRNPDSGRVDPWGYAPGSQPKPGRLDAPLWQGVPASRAVTGRRGIHGEVPMIPTGATERSWEEIEEIKASKRPGPSTPVIQTTTWALPKRIQKRISRNLKKRKRMQDLRTWIGMQFVTAGTICLIVHFTQFMMGGGVVHMVLAGLAGAEIAFGLLWPRVDKRPAVG